MRILLSCLTGFLAAMFTSCSNLETTQVGENTFVYKTKVYKIVDNEVTIIGDLKSDSIRKFQVHQPVKREFGESSLSFVKEGATATLDALYRGNFLYFNLFILDFNDLRTNYTSGEFTIQFADEYGFIIHTTEIPTNQLTGMIGNDNETIVAFTYNGKTEMSSDIYKAIKRYSVSSSVKEMAKTNSVWSW